ncbi:MAG: PRC-barrel domain-containing protein [Microlunatus sp.]|nr:PRC-barrel domain-containing protein [Microlunatus sp.]MDN5770755.1 PRC-barrel domain-containing protein [Microlunatus sp.]MDN5804387.1 PRC-barrel domain-containing protein [Microlunatus sp.]
MRFSQARGQKIVSTSTAGTVGRVSGFVVDPSTSRIAAVRVKKAASGDTLPWTDITSFGVDAVTVDDAARITEASEKIASLSGRKRKVIGRRVLSTAGNELGRSSDVEFDQESGAVTAIVLNDEKTATGKVVGIGSYAVVWQED